MQTAKVSFSRAETFTQGWRGKQSRTTIYLNGAEVGEIRGEENAAGVTFGMWWRIHLGITSVAADSYADAKAKARFYLETGEWQ